MVTLGGKELTSLFVCVIYLRLLFLLPSITVCSSQWTTTTDTPTYYKITGYLCWRHDKRAAAEQAKGSLYKDYPQN